MIVVIRTNDDGIVSVESDGLPVVKVILHYEPCGYKWLPVKELFFDRKHEAIEGANRNE